MKKTFGLATLTLALMSGALCAVKTDFILLKAEEACEVQLRSVNYGLTEIMNYRDLAKDAEYVFPASRLPNGLYRININYPDNQQNNEENYFLVDDSFPLGFIALAQYMGPIGERREMIDGYAFCLFDRKEDIANLVLSANTQIQKLNRAGVHVVSSTAASFTVTFPCARFHFNKEDNGLYRFVKVTFDHVALPNDQKRQEILVANTPAKPVAAPAARAPVNNDDDNDPTLTAAMEFSRIAHLADLAEQEALQNAKLAQELADEEAAFSAALEFSKMWHDVEVEENRMAAAAAARAQQQQNHDDDDDVDDKQVDPAPAAPAPAVVDPLVVRRAEAQRRADAIEKRMREQAAAQQAKK